jgi:pimeloyl-ACP methyl ester carboxylesterase
VVAPDRAPRTGGLNEVGSSGPETAWEASGSVLEAGDDRIWHARFPAMNDCGRLPLLVLHGFPTCSFDWHRALPVLRAERDVVVLDFPGFGLSSKPDRRYSVRTYADAVVAVIAHLGLDLVDLLTHDVGDTVGGELLARDLDATLRFGVRRRVLTNGSIYIDLARLTDGQQLLLALPDERNEALGADEGAAFARGVVATFAPDSGVDGAEVEALTRLAAREGGLALLPRTIRYIEDRRAEERRFTGALERHPSPVGVVWGDVDPVAVVEMVARFSTARPDAPVTVLDGVGHYPMVEAPQRFAIAVLEILDAG